MIFLLSLLFLVHLLDLDLLSLLRELTSVTSHSDRVTLSNYRFSLRDAFGSVIFMGKYHRAKELVLTRPLSPIYTLNCSKFG